MEKHRANQSSERAIPITRDIVEKTFSASSNARHPVFSNHGDCGGPSRHLPILLSWIR
jgi:hypothetical protein